MRLADILDHCLLTTVIIDPEHSLAESARSMQRTGAPALLVEDQGLLMGLVTAEDIIRALVTAGEIIDVWNGPVRAIVRPIPVVATEEKLAQVIGTMAATGISALPVTVSGRTQVVSLCQLLQAQVTNLHGEVQHLQTYIDALHDASND